MNAVLVDFDVLTPFGHGINALWQGVLSGTSAFDMIDRFDTTPFASHHGALVSDLDPTSSPSLTIQMIRRLLPDSNAIPKDATLLLATTVGAIDTLERHALAGESDSAAGNPEGLLDHVQAHLNLTGPARIVSAACASSTVALAEAASIIRAGHGDAVLVVACDIVSEFVFSGFSTLMALDSKGAQPFDNQRKGLSLGEAAAWVLVMSDERATKEKRAIAAVVSGYGLSNDANHMTGPSRDGSGLARAIDLALRSANQTPAAVAAIHAHGTGTIYNDAMEMKAFHSVFGKEARPVFSIKGAVGHTLGTAGLIEMLVAVQSLTDRTAPPTAGLQTPDPLACGWVSNSAQPLSTNPALLTTNSGFGGINAALLIEGHPSASKPKPFYPTNNDERKQAPVQLMGGGWITPQQFGQIARRATHSRNEDPRLDTLVRNTDLFPSRPKNYARFDDHSRLAYVAAALALQDSGHPLQPDAAQPTGIIGSFYQGALSANRAYFNDYLAAGRTMGRGNLFIYTLPTSPLAETAIHFKLAGPLLHVTPAEKPLGVLIDIGNRLIQDGQCRNLLLVLSDPQLTLALLIGQQDETKGSLGPVNAIPAFLEQQALLPFFLA